jgi:quercetin dioxygenase-like cupin family protein
VIPRYGTYVSQIEINEIRCAFEVKIKPEALAREAAAKRISADKLEELQALIKDAEGLVKEKGHRKLVEIDNHFYEIIYQSTQNPILQQILENIHCRCERLWTSALSKRIPFPEIINQPNEIYIAIKREVLKRPPSFLRRRIAMIVMNATDVKKNKIETYPYNGKLYVVKNMWVQWLSQAGPKDSPEYGLRFFTIGPEGEIPIHKHFYVQTMYILSGCLSVVSHHSETNEKAEEKVMGPGDFVFVPSMEAHSMRNLSDTEDATFLCCIANVYEDESI